MGTNLHYRLELKYYITTAEYMELVPRVRAVLDRDPHIGESGRYLIRSIYFDNYFDKALREKLDGVCVREKFRIRWYNDDFSTLKLEKKMKNHSLCLKYSARLTEDECYRILRNETDWMKQQKNELIQELALKEDSQLLRPKVMVSYLREPYIYSPGNVRITFDSDIRTSMYHPFGEEILAPDVSALTEQGMVMEVKYDAYLPEIIAALLQIGKIRQTAFSKYGICRRFG